jgi:UDP-glucose 4-epimerase/UDP-arabinose 4-epimerase
VRWGPLIEGDIRDADALNAAFRRYDVAAVIHFAGLIEVARSWTDQALFWDVNVAGTDNLLAAMKRRGVPRLIFSSSAAVYGQGQGDPLAPLREDAPKHPASPYGETKLEAEHRIQAQCRAGGLTAIALRYFNAAGADPSGLIGEAHEPETHLIPLAIGACIDGGKPLTVFGADFATPDGSCVRDYVHVCDLADAHVAALEADLGGDGMLAANIGSGVGHSVMQVIDQVGRAAGQPVPFEMGPRRPGDPPSLVADPKLAEHRLGWRATRSTLGRVIGDALSWEKAPAYGRPARRSDVG